jgi:hypothetical protein
MNAFERMNGPSEAYSAAYVDTFIYRMPDESTQKRIKEIIDYGFDHKPQAPSQPASMFDRLKARVQSAIGMSDVSAETVAHKVNEDQTAGPTLRM